MGEFLRFIRANQSRDGRMAVSVGEQLDPAPAAWTGLHGQPCDGATDCCGIDLHQSRRLPLAQAVHQHQACR